MDTYTLRAITETDLPGSAALMAQAFLLDHRAEEFQAMLGPILGSGPATGAFDGDQIVGCLFVLNRTVCLPGTGLVPFGGVSSVAVAPDHRRRGLLTRIMRATLTESSPAISGLWASEAPIYGRFGFGQATETQDATIRSKAPFRAGIDLGTDRVRELSRERAWPLVHEIYDQYAATRVGMLGREEVNWEYHYHDSVAARRDASAYRFVIHPEGYAAFRVRGVWEDNGPAGKVSVHEFVALTPQAHAALWRYLLDLDHAAELTANLATDDLLPLILFDPRATVRKTLHALHIRLTDVARALPMRGYSAPVDVVIDVADEFCPWNAGKLRFTVSAGVATVERTTAAADLSTSSTELGAAFLGGTRLTALAAAGRVQEHTAGAVAALSAAFLAEREPVCQEIF
ncbi:GNAT family N-acetyltransferase [Actinokineospora sp. NBRC 105648]|uniref:GNAT family N-acetyltransferase n=1 Tax=Actinokineospora sp. NBRC 105648 TaxID=3032206 RepID=UPI0024A4B6E7|nr:GNAT family N-acetyltransferase [Actinokineospora sp. NBRC 105648]GLZ37752.1 UPF0256 protein [Actinokineospora sp. NBRC 105648]